MPGIALGIGATNPKRGAVQYDARRIDGVKFVIPSGAGVTSAPIGSLVTLQESDDAKQVIVLGAAPLTVGSTEYAIIGVGFLEAASQANSQVDQTAGVYEDGDYVAMISDVSVVAMSPVKTGETPTAGGAAYITPAGEISNASSGNVAFPGEVFYGTPGIQTSGQLKTGYAFARLKYVTIG